MQRRTCILFVGLAGAMLAAIGCTDAPQGDQPASAGGNAPPVVEWKSPANSSAAADNSSAANAPQQDENADAEVAKVGFGKKGHYDSNDYISVTVGAQFRARERITLLNITHAMQIYKAEHAEYPQTQEEFWEKIIKANSIQLPELPAGQKFLYDPELAKETNGADSLKILRPKKP